MDEAALRRALCFEDTRVVQRLLQLISNIVTRPDDEKYRTLKLNNAVVQSVLEIPGARDFLRSAGFKCTPERPGIFCMDAPSEQMLQALQRAQLRVSCDLQARAAVAEGEPLPQRSEASAIPAAETNQKLVVFDFDSTITVDGDSRAHGLQGERLEMLQDMANRLLAADVCTVLVTKQFLFHTQTHTVPVLKQAGLACLFCALETDHSQGPDAMLYRKSPMGGIYTGVEARDKIPLIGKILAGENRWCLRFNPTNVLFIDDNIDNLRGHEDLGISVRHVQGDGMSEEDVNAILSFACGSTC